MVVFFCLCEEVAFGVSLKALMINFWKKLKSREILPEGEPKDVIKEVSMKAPKDMYGP